MTRGGRDVLFLAHRIPYPPDKGDKIRSWRLLERLSERFAVHLACFVDDPEDRRHEGVVRERCRSAIFPRLRPPLARLRSAAGLVTGAPLTLPYYFDREIAAFVEAARATGLVAEIAFSSSMAQYLATPAGAARLVDLCDADSAKWSAYADRRRGPMRWVYRREAGRLAAEEARILSWADASFAVSPSEAALLGAGAGAGRADWFGNGVDAAFFDPALEFAPVPEPPDFVFVGMMDYWANEEAALWFAGSVWPKVRAHAPAARFAIVGARPGPRVRALDGTDGVRVTGRVEDVRPWLVAAHAAIAPLRIARGVQNKVLEGMAMAKAVIATPGAAEGIEATPGEHLAVAASADNFAAACLDALHRPVEAAAMGARARALVLDRYDWDRQLDRFDAALDRAIGAGRGTDASFSSASHHPGIRG